MIRPAGWAALVICLLLGLVGTTLRLDPRILDISPFTHLPHLPGGKVTVAPLIWLSALAVALLTAGRAALRRRDLPIA